MEFQWDADNLRHVQEESPRGVTPDLVIEIAEIDPVIVDNLPGEGRSGSHKLIGPGREGRYWTIVLLHLYDDVWRPITG